MPYTTRLEIDLAAPPEQVYLHLITARSIGIWMVPDNMTSFSYTFSAVNGGRFRISLTYENPDRRGKSISYTIIQKGTFVKLEPNRQVVQKMAFETADPRLQGEMTLTFTLSPTSAGTRLLTVHDGIPDGVAITDNKRAWSQALTKLAKLVERTGMVNGDLANYD